MTLSPSDVEQIVANDTREVRSNVLERSRGRRRLLLPYVNRDAQDYEVALLHAREIARQASNYHQSIDDILLAAEKHHRFPASWNYKVRGVLPEVVTFLCNQYRVAGWKAEASDTVIAFAKRS
jgi:hypothetical protein